MEKDDMVSKERAGEVPLIQPVEAPKPKLPKSKLVIGGVYGLLVLLGIGTGYLLAGNTGKPGFINTEKVVGTTDTKTFRDSAEGTIEKDGIEGEGNHKIIREGGPSQSAY